uniref:Uncharacterized protein n=1 Tax=Oryza nivara TaxID=4536 RepID=A0A0E0HZE5_ORYNI
MARGRAALLIPPLKLGEEGPGQDLHASCLSMKIGAMFQEVIPKLQLLNQSSSAPFQAIIGITSKTFYSLQSQGAISFSQVKSDTEAVS